MSPPVYRDSAGGSLRHPPVRGAEVGVSPQVELAGEVHGWRQVAGGVNELGQTGVKRGSGVCPGVILGALCPPSACWDTPPLPELILSLPVHWDSPRRGPARPRDQL